LWEWFSALRERFAALGQGVAAAWQWFSALRERFPALRWRVSAAWQRLAVLRLRLTAPRQRLTSLRQRLSPLRQRLRGLAWVSHAAVSYSGFIRHDPCSQMFSSGAGWTNCHACPVRGRLGSGTSCDADPIVGPWGAQTPQRWHVCRSGGAVALAGGYLVGET
jgi:hypothetical protein